MNLPHLAANMLGRLPWSVTLAEQERVLLQGELLPAVGSNAGAVATAAGMLPSDSDALERFQSHTSDLHKALQVAGGPARCLSCNGSDGKWQRVVSKTVAAAMVAIAAHEMGPLRLGLVVFSVPSSSSQRYPCLGSSSVATHFSSLGLSSFGAERLAFWAQLFQALEGHQGSAAAAERRCATWNSQKSFMKLPAMMGCSGGCSRE